jgi:Raf kinase inhibitor-like YbhB/YbcL family protein
MSIQLTSPAFEEGGMIPQRFSCDGKDVSPQLDWSGVPDGTSSLALICDDPDAPVGTWDHWILFNIPAGTTSLPEGVPADETLENGARHGVNSWRRVGYGGPCPPGGTHRYFFKLYALDTKIDLTAGATKDDLLGAIEGHVLAEGQLMGRYKR